jgi:two-component system chemotaxis response regulator CheB
VDAVVVGTSAGGVEALLGLLGGLPSGFPAAVLVALHRTPEPPAVGETHSAAAELFGQRCRLPVSDAWHGEPVRAGRVLLAPPDHHLLIDPGPVVVLSCDEPVLWSRPAIDPLFESAAEVFGPRLLALVLTGASADGALGAQAVVRRGGTLWVQDPGDAQVPTMPRAALQAARAEAVLTLDEIRARLARAPVEATARPAHAGGPSPFSAPSRTP